MNYVNESEREFREWQAAVAMQYGLEIEGRKTPSKTKPRQTQAVKKASRDERPTVQVG